MRVLDVDPDLGTVLPAADRVEARHELVARAVWCAPGRWALPVTRNAAAGWIGVLIVDGMVSRTLTVSGRRSTELLGPGDLTRPWSRAEPASSLRSRVTWEVLERARVALLDARFAALAGRWPAVQTALVARATARADDLALQLAIHGLPRIQDRLLAALWHFADRWGRVGMEGIVLSLPLSHSALAAVIGTGRPSVTSALSTLRREGLLRRREDGSWLLLGQPPEPPRA